MLTQGHHTCAHSHKTGRSIERQQKQGRLLLPALSILNTLLSRQKNEQIRPGQYRIRVGIQGTHSAAPIVIPSSCPGNPITRFLPAPCCRDRHVVPRLGRDLAGKANLCTRTLCKGADRGREHVESVKRKIKKWAACWYDGCAVRHDMTLQ